MLGALDQSYLVRLLDALANDDGADLMAVADEMASRSLSYNGALQDLGTLLHRIALAQTVPAALPDDLPELADVQRLATQFDPQEVQLYYQIAVHGRNEIGLAPDEYAGFTMTLLRMLAFRPGQGGAEQEAMPAPAALARSMPQAAPPRPAAAAAPAAAARPAGPAAAAHTPGPAAAAHTPGPAPAPTAAPAGAGRAMTSARAALDAALEAARAGSRMGGVPRRPAPAAAPAPAAPAPAAQPAPGPSAVAAPARAAAPAPWDASPQNTAAPQPQPAMQQQQARAQGQGNEQAVAEDEPPAWVTEFSDDSAVAMDTPAVAAPPAPARVATPSAPPYAYVITPVPAIDWDGNWPALAASLPLRGVAQQLAFQTELVECAADGAAATFRLRVPVDTLRASGNSEKLCAALQERFPAVRVNVETEIAPTWYTASAEAKARRERLQREAEAAVEGDPFVQEMARTFDAFVVPGSVRPTAV
jgi:DNA polymerase-3 subunit gamma/tau